MTYTQQFCSAQEVVVRHPMAPTWPETMMTTVTFEPEGPNKTRVMVRWEPHAKASAEEVATFVSARAGMTGGWTGSFDKLELLLNAAACGVSDFRRGQTPSGPVASIRLRIAKHEIQQAMDPAMQELFSTLAAQHNTPTGPWFTVHHSMTPDAWDFDVCIPVKSHVIPSGRVVHQALEAAPAFIGTYVGPYEGLAKAWPALRAWMQAQSMERAERLCEMYEVGPESGRPPSEWKTILFQPLKSSP